MAPPMIRENVSGVYGFPTSTMDWCEENFVVTYAIAEFWNTISNWVMIFPPMFVAYRLWKFQLAEYRVITAFIALMTIGFGSFAFHCTLLYQSQLLDELPMIYGTCVMLYCMLELHGIENKINIFTSAVLIAISIAITMVYVLLKSPLIFLYSYGTLATTLFMLNIRACARYTGNRKLLILSLASYTFGFILWNIDNEYCQKVRKVRNALPFLFQPITQLHALWHFFAGIGTYGQIIFTMDLRIKCLHFDSRSAYICKYILYFVKAQSFKHNFKDKN
ncbi:alkaline ceramidase 3 [Hydra vulgaris]|uniref:Alkaline ceramidase n=1 Tax=Hydra vulgaris TaxID=6087 RepID=T2M460_HYDVU|nr:alkaline ceramidase 3 [Hydra vulgaris]